MARQPSVGELQQQIAALQAQVAALLGRPIAPVQDPRDRADYVEHGSDDHAALLGLRKATDEDGKLVIDGWTLEDITQYGPAASDEFLMRVLRQKINELTMEIPTYQSVDPRAPNFRPTMWTPGTRLADITE